MSCPGGDSFFTFPIIDFHVHLFPDQLFRAIWKAFERDYSWGVTYHLYTPEVIRFLRTRGVEKIVFSNYAHREGIAPSLNDWNLKLLEQDSNLYCFAAFHPGDPGYLNPLKEILAHPRVLGCKLQLLVQRFYPHDDRLNPLYQAVIEAGKRMLIHAGTGPVGNEFVGISQFRKLMKRFPELKVNVPHLGEMETESFFDLLGEYPGLYLDTAFALFQREMRTDAVEADTLLRHQDRIVYGSDFPNLVFEWEREIRILKEMDLGDAFYRKIFWENGLRLLRESGAVR